MSIAELRKLPPAEKLRIIEAPWSDLVDDDEAVVSPPWHEEELRTTEADFCIRASRDSGLGHRKKAVAPVF
jgi:hypothetical protein